MIAAGTGAQAFPRVDLAGVYRRLITLA